MKKLVKTILSLAMALNLSLSSVVCTSFADFVKKEDGKTYYTDDNGKNVTGWQTIGDKKYYFDKNGVMKTGWLTMKSGNKYYFKKDGSMATGWLKIGDDKYYFSKKGIMTIGNTVIGEKIYCFDDDGELLKQYKDCAVKIDGKWYSVDKNGNLDKNIIINLDNNKSYYIGKNGYAISTTVVKDGITYVFDAKNGLVDSYIKLKVGAFNNKYISLSDFKAELKETYTSHKITYSGTIKNTTDRDLSVYIYASFYDADGKLIDNKQIIGISNLGAGETYKINEYKYIDDVVYSMKFTDVNIY